MFRMYVAGLAAAALLGVSPCPSGEIRVFAAVSLSDALEEISSRFFQQTCVGLRLNLGASNDLARQLTAGARADLFLAADDHQAMRVVAAGRALATERFELLSNSLVVVASAGTRRELASPRELLAFDRLAMADPAGVPLGVYAKEWLEHEKVWAELAPRVVPMLDARATVAAVASGDLPVGIVYATDAAASSRVRVIYRVPMDRGPRVRYVVVPISDSSEKARVGRFLRFLNGPAARAIFERHGFVVVRQSPEG